MYCLHCAGPGRGNAVALWLGGHAETPVYQGEPMRQGTTRRGEPYWFVWYPTPIGNELVKAHTADRRCPIGWTYDNCPSCSALATAGV